MRVWLASARFTGRTINLEFAKEALRDLLALQDTPVHAAMTPRTVIFSLSDQTTVEEFFHRYEQEPFSRIPIYAGDDTDNVTGFVLRSDLLLAQARGNNRKLLEKYRRDMPSVPAALQSRAARRRRDNPKPEHGRDRSSPPTVSAGSMRHSRGARPTT
mgnify:CR=1 FL=1